MAHIEIKTKNKTPSIFTEIYVDGHKLTGVRRFELTQDVCGMPILTVDLNALDLSIDLEAVRINQYGMGEIKQLSFIEKAED